MYLHIVNVSEYYSFICIQLVDKQGEIIQLMIHQDFQVIPCGKYNFGMSIIDKLIIIYEMKRKKNGNSCFLFPSFSFTICTSWIVCKQQL